MGGEGQRAFRHDLGGAVGVGVGHGHDQPPRTGSQVHRSAHAQQRLAGHRPVRQVAACVHLQAAHDRHVHVPAPDHAEAAGRIEVTRAGQGRHGNFPGVDGVVQRAAVLGRGADPQHAVFGVQVHVQVRRDQVRDQRGNPDAQVHHVAGAQLLQGAAGHVHAGVVHLLGPAPHAGAAAQVFQRQRSLHQIIHVQAGRMHLLRRNLAHRNDLLDLRDHQASGGRHRRVEVLLGQAVLEVPCRVRPPRPDQRHVAAQGGHEDHFLTVQDAGVGVPGNHGSGGGGRVKAAQARAPGTQRLGQRALRQQLHLQPAFLVGPDRFRVGGEVTADRLPDLPSLQQPPAAQSGFGDVVRHVGQVAHVRFGQRMHEVHRVSRHAEAADQQRLPGADHSGRFLRSDHGNRFHACTRSMIAASPWPTPTHRVARP